jgi:ferredoxin
MLEHIGRTMVLMRAGTSGKQLAGVVFPFLCGTCVAACPVNSLQRHDPVVKGTKETYGELLAAQREDGPPLLLEWAPKSTSGDHALLLSASARSPSHIVFELQWKNWKSQGPGLFAAKVQKEIKKTKLGALAAMGASAGAPAVVLVVLCTNVGPELAAMARRVLTAGSEQLAGKGNKLRIPAGLEVTIATEADMKRLLGSSQLEQCLLRA